MPLTSLHSSGFAWDTSVWSTFLFTACNLLPSTNFKHPLRENIFLFPPSPNSSSKKFAIVPHAWTISSADSASHLHSLISVHLYLNTAIIAREMFVVFSPSIFKHLQETLLIGCCGKYTCAHAHTYRCAHTQAHINTHAHILFKLTAEAATLWTIC